MIRLKHHSNKSKTISVRTAKPLRTTCTQNNGDFTHFLHFAKGTDLSVRTAKPLRTTCTQNNGDFTRFIHFAKGTDLSVRTAKPLTLHGPSLVLEKSMKHK